MENDKKLLLVALALFIALSAWVIHGVSREAWFDVSFSLETVHKMRTEGVSSIDFQHYDVHSPLYYTLLYGWSYLNPGTQSYGWYPGISEFVWAQWFSVLLMCGFLIFVWLGMRARFGEDGAAVTVLLAMCTTYLHYGTEVRTYALELMLSAMVFAAVMQWEKSWRWELVGMFGAMLLPLTHYFGVMAPPFFAALLFIRLAKEKKVAWRGGFIILIGWVIGLAMALFFAIPQRLRTQGTWFQPPGVESWPSSIFYAFFAMDSPIEGVVGVAFSWLYVSFLALMVFLAWKAWRWMQKGDLGEEKKVLIMMGVTALFPLLGLAGAPLLGGEGFSNLYHHRFFLVVTWMFAALVALLIVRKGKVLTAGFILLAGLMLFMYGQTAHHELENIMDATPCHPVEFGDDGLGYPWKATIIHESPFSALPYEVYAREHGCYWRNVVSTNITRRMANGGGFDAVDEENVYWNLTLPEGNYYYVNATSIVPRDGKVYTVAQEDGVSLLYVERETNV